MNDNRSPRDVYLDGIGTKFEAEKNEAISWRAEFDNRFADAERLYRFGSMRIPDTKDERQDKERHRKVPDNIVRQKVRTIAARIQDMVFPTNGGNFGLEHSPIPDLGPVASAMDHGVAMDVVALKEIAAKKAQKMEQILKDYLEECDYSKVGRSLIMNGCKYGTAILKGPFPRVVKHKKRTTIQGPAGPVVQFEFDKKMCPVAEEVDVRNFFPMPARCIEECEATYELHLMTKSQVRRLAEQGFDPEQVNRLLAQEPDCGSLAERPMLARDGTSAAVLKNKYPIWERRGPLPRECLSYFGIELPEEDNLTTVHGQVWFSQGITLKAAPSDLEDDTQIYHVWCYEKDPDSIFGYGVPHACAADQEAANLAWSAAVLNAMASAIPITAFLKGALEAQDGDMQWPPQKPLILKNLTEDLGKAVQFQVIPSTVGDSLAIYERAKQNADEHTMLPFMAAGDATKAQQTASGFAMAINEINIVQKQAAQSWDDDITARIIPAFVDWYMLHGDDDEAKGDYDVVPQVTSHNLIKDLQAQQLMQLLMLADNPGNSAYLNREKIIRNLAGALDGAMDDVLNSPEQVQEAQAQQAPPPDPRLEIEQMRMAEAEKQRAHEMEMARFKMQVDLQVSQNTLAAADIKAAAQTQLAQDDMAVRERIAAQSEQTKRLQADIDARLKLRDQDAKDRKAAADLRLKAHQITAKERSEQRQIAVEKPVRLA